MSALRASAHATIDQIPEDKLEDVQTVLTIMFAKPKTPSLMELTKNIPIVKLDRDENGNLLVDPEKHPHIYDWVVNG